MSGKTGRYEWRVAAHTCTCTYLHRGHGLGHLALHVMHLNVWETRDPAGDEKEQRKEEKNLPHLSRQQPHSRTACLMMLI